MSSVAAAQLQRLLHIIPYLADDQEHAIESVAALVGAEGPAQLLDDLATLVDRLGPRVGFGDDVQVCMDGQYVSMFANHFLRPMRLTTQELCALELGLAVLRSECPPEDHDAIDRARERLRATATELATHDGRDDLWSAALSTPGDRTRLFILRTACRQRQKVRLIYRGGDDTESTTRVVCPYRFFFTNAMWYVVAYCERATSIRFFRLDRIESVEMIDESFELPDDTSLDAIVRDGRMIAGAPEETMQVRYSARIARWIAEREGVPVDADGTLTLEHPVYDRQWAVRYVLPYGPEAEVLGPPDIRAFVIGRLQALCRTVVRADGS